MAWIESHQELERHPKTFELMSQMSWDLDTCLGKLHRFWWWCVDYAQDGDLRKHNDNRIAIAMGVAMQDSKRLVEAMVTAGWLDREPYFRVHDWWDYIGLFLQRRYADKPNNWKNIQQMYSNLTVNCQESVMSLAQPNLTKPNLTKPNLTTKNIGDDFALPDWIPKSEWQSYLEMRKTIKKPLKTPGAINLAICKLSKLKELGSNPKEVLEQSIFNSWQGLFEIRKEGSGGNGHTGRGQQPIARSPESVPGKYANVQVTEI